MAHVNELKYAALKILADPVKGHLNELEYQWLAGLHPILAAQGASLNELWFQEFIIGGAAGGAKAALPWNTNAYIYLGVKGATADSLSERWYQVWDGGGPVVIVTPDLTLTAGDNGGARVGFRAGSYGSVAPDQLTTGDPILALFCNNNNGRVRFKVAGEYPADSFTSMTIVGQGELLAASATYDYDGAETEWSWMSTGFNLTSGDTYAVEFL